MKFYFTDTELNWGKYEENKDQNNYQKEILLHTWFFIHKL